MKIVSFLALAVKICERKLKGDKPEWQWSCHQRRNWRQFQLFATPHLNCHATKVLLHHLDRPKNRLDVPEIEITKNRARFHDFCTINYFGDGLRFWDLDIRGVQRIKHFDCERDFYEFMKAKFWDIQHSPWNSTLRLEIACVRDFYVLRCHMDSTPKSWL